MSSYKIAIRYAISLFSLAVENNKLEAVESDITQFVHLCNQSRPLRLFLRNPLIPNHRKSLILRKIFEKRFDDLTFAFMDIVTRKNRENYLLEIAQLFLDKYRDYKGIIIARLQSSMKFDITEKNKLVELIKKSLGDHKSIDIIEQINKKLIGGFMHPWP